jgi:2-polyprenyl-3-methyl-5-hydroxy-6-metoxy-1,4-benzoquinol methylase
MDDGSIGYEDFYDCLRDLETVNKLTFAYRPIRQWLNKTVFASSVTSSLSILDVGSGGGDALRLIARASTHAKRWVQLTGVDLNPWSKRYAQDKTPASLNIVFEESNIFNFEPERRFDYILSSLFTHHLSNDDLVRFIKWMDHHATKGWFINDLHRHPMAYYGFKILTAPFRFHFMVRHDGPISVARAFSKNDWVETLKAADVPLNDVTLQWFFPFRYCLVRRKP